MPKGYVIIVRDYVAEIVEFRTLQIVTTPDDIRLYHVVTKYGEDFFKESEVSSIRKSLEKECEDMNKALRGLHARSDNKIH